MSTVNKVILIGNLGRDPELRYTKAGGAVCNFSIATSEEWKDKQSGEKKERTEWHRIVVWNIQAENCAQYLSKGRSVYVEGSLQTKEWEDKEGNKRYTTEVQARDVKFLGGKQDGEQRSESTPDHRDYQHGAPGTPKSGIPQGGNEGPPQDEIPF